MKRTVGILIAVFIGSVFSSAIFAEDCTKDDVRAKVEEVAAALEKKGKSYFSEIPRIRFCGNNYVYVSDMEVTILAHGWQPNLVGRNLISLKDDTGFKFFYELLAKLKASSATKDGTRYFNGTGWVKYRWPTPDDKTQLHTKLVYAKAILLPEGGNVFVAAGLSE